MKVSLRILLIGILFAGTLFYHHTVAVAAEGTSFAYVDVAKLFDEYNKTKDNDRTLQEKGRKKEEERDALVHEVRQLKDELVLVSESAKDEKQKQLESKIHELQEFDQQAKQDLGGQRQEIVRQIFKDIDDSVQRYGERKGIDFIFNERALLYHKNSYDVTAEVLQDLNKSYGKQKH